jgi:hypothetical protein
MDANISASFVGGSSGFFSPLLGPYLKIGR